MLKKVIIASAATAIALLGAAGVAYADDESDSGPDAAPQQGHSQDLNLDNGASRNLDTGHFLGFLSI
ncbi:MAG TPA: hypothetical protein VGD73_15175 [Pseudonocardia sp.]|jgi:hypothetical protein|uniref:hypothetical protein n=1 Tax=Pseudonocardia sp. TaxID=60912 RepID=UPI002EDA9B70